MPGFYSNESKNELKNLIALNNSKINMNKKKIHELNTISTENRLGRIAILAEFAYLPICLSVVLLKLVSFQMMPLTILGSSLTIGLLGNIITEKMFDVKRRVANVSNAKNESEREEEVFKYELENEKLNNKNLALALAVETIDRETSLLDEVSKTGKYVVASKNTLNDKDKLEKKKEELEIQLKSKNETLDELSTKKFLSDKKRGIHDWMDISMYTMEAGLPVGLMSVLPLFGYGSVPVPGSPLIYLVSILGAMGISMGVSVSFLTSKNKRQKNILKKYMKDEENLDVEEDLRLTMAEISKKHVELQENKRKLEEIKRGSKADTSGFVRKKHEYELESVCGLTAVFSNDEIGDIEEMSSEIEGPSLVKRDKHKKHK